MTIRTYSRIYEIAGMRLEFIHRIRYFMLMRSLPVGDIQRVLRSRNPKTIVIFIILMGLAYWFQSGKPSRDTAEDAALRGSFSGTCINVIDGDTLDVRNVEGQEFRIRLIGVDSMETHNEEKMAEQAKRLGRTVVQIRLLGERAREQMRDWALNMPVTWEVPSGTPVHDPYDRLLGYVEVEGQDLGEELLRGGLAELRRDPHPRAERYRNSARPLLQ